MYIIHRSIKIEYFNIKINHIISVISWIGRFLLNYVSHKNFFFPENKRHVYQDILSVHIVIVASSALLECEMVSY